MSVEVIEDVVGQLGHLTLGTRLKRIGERLQAQTQRILDAHGLEIQAGQFPFLAAIDRMGPLTIGGLASSVGVTQPAATRTVAQLAEVGFVKVTHSEKDQRRKNVALTKRGQRLVEIGKENVWPRIDTAVKQLCGKRSRPLLEQLAAIEEGLEKRSLEERAARKEKNR